MRFDIQNKQDFPHGNTLSQWDISGYDNYDSTIMPLFGISFVSKTIARGSCCLSKYDWEWDAEAPEGECICPKNQDYHIYSLIVSVIIEKGTRTKPMESQFQIDFIQGEFKLVQLPHILSRDGTIPASVFTIAKTMDQTEEHPQKDLLLQISHFENDAIIEQYHNDWFYTFKGLDTAENYHKAFLTILDGIINNNKPSSGAAGAVIAEEKKENPHVGRKTKAGKK